MASSGYYELLRASAAFVKQCDDYDEESEGSLREYAKQRALVVGLTQGWVRPGPKETMAHLIQKMAAYKMTDAERDAVIKC